MSGGETQHEFMEQFTDVQAARSQWPTEPIGLDVPSTPESRKELPRGRPGDLDAVTETKYPFSDGVRNGGFELGSDDMRRFWRLLTLPGSGVVDCYTNEQMEPHQSIAKSVAVACERAIELAAAHASVMDRIAFLDSRREAGELYEDIRRSELVAQCMVIFDEWKLSTTRIAKLRSNLSACRADRIARLEEAIALQPALSKQGSQAGSWTPDAAFLDTMKSEVLEMKRSVRMTTYYRMQSAFAHQTGRPFFCPSELNRSGELSFQNDPYSRHPIKGTVAERFRAMALAVAN
jgi:hypothetical protein